MSNIPKQDPTKRGDLSTLSFGSRPIGAADSEITSSDAKKKKGDSDDEWGFDDEQE